MVFDSVYNGTALQKIPFSGAFKKVAELLNSDETPVLATIVNVYKSGNASSNSLSMKNKKPYAVVITDKRIFFSMKEGLNEDLYDVRLENIQEINQKTNNLTQFQVSIRTINATITMDCTRKNYTDILKGIRK